ncbi:hypothetical protein NJB14197_06270 [Mycobacterium montefiorense]|uniref:Uncharacterized protein n=1 Tax=Mycobacterium montefiorense TaxID=154654 RepID=A0AA37UVN4_9MYCO|nr:hypothetical protein MmonteBS_36700 [Mycobacterium montefiorense]GKU37676.1 hypothetical protein NJB14191_50220 [Mycobacterium montefiorense]GKU41881.1 hypothetical protein NJB14192_38640 [Mycobacterium montefiorense]GKU45662.1 hypothetical protein NJB14194_22830 [Mycobacterium montefiorense]GKU53381.1 hypothetical protein NJB14195_46220 [Mycobacterium montefiorense]
MFSGKGRSQLPIATPRATSAIAIEEIKSHLDGRVGVDRVPGKYAEAGGSGGGVRFDTPRAYLSVAIAEILSTESSQLRVGDHGIPAANPKARSRLIERQC